MSDDPLAAAKSAVADAHAATAGNHALMDLLGEGERAAHLFVSMLAAALPHLLAQTARETIQGGAGTPIPPGTSTQSAGTQTETG